ncbi:Nitroreductase [Periconia macrospinosa]|uniref:Nitroreductase n=1 Tax=Periconia macrospinosa TaxID=97972 RepID=A0A2V1DJ23_9PLEO|nr:Nitroreductase [Periconia macrospinosa]
MLQKQHSNDLKHTILSRHTTREFSTTNIPRLSLVEECLSIAQASPSATNIQPWRLTIASGAALKRLSEKLTTAFRNGVPSTNPLIPDKFHKYQSELGAIVYGPDGWNITRDDKKGQIDALAGNFRFYDAPYAAIISFPKSLGPADLMSVGLYVQTLVLLLTERGVATALIASPTGYPDIIRKELEIGEDEELLSALLIGYEEEGKSINTVKLPRDDWREHVKYVSE